MRNINDLAATANALVAKKKGILAADESTGTITKRFNTVNVEWLRPITGGNSI